MRHFFPFFLQCFLLYWSFEGMAAAPDPHEVLRSTPGKENFQRVARLLISGGTRLLREIFDRCYPPSCLSTILSKPSTKTQLQTAKLTRPQWQCLYPSPGVYGKSTDFDITLLFRLLRTICHLAPPAATGWDTLPPCTDQSLTADLVRIKYYRNSVYGHVSEEMDISNEEFPLLWQNISDALERIAGNISSEKKDEWRKAIGVFLTDPLTTEDRRNVEELERWYEDDREVKQSVKELHRDLQSFQGVVTKKLQAMHQLLLYILNFVAAHLSVSEGKFLETETTSGVWIYHNLR